MKITEEQYDKHDCHLSEEDGCGICVAYWNQGIVRDQSLDAVVLAERMAHERVGLIF